MSEIFDIVGKELIQDKEAIFVVDGSIFKGKIKAFNKSGFVKIIDNLKNEYIVKNPKKELYLIPDNVDLSEIFEVEIKPRQKKPTERDFYRELSQAKDIMNNGILDGDKVLFAYDNGIYLGRTVYLEKNTNKLTITINKDKQDVEIETNGKNIYLLKPDYYIKEKNAYI